MGGSRKEKSEQKRKETRGTKGRIRRSECRNVKANREASAIIKRDITSWRYQKFNDKEKMGETDGIRPRSTRRKTDNAADDADKHQRDKKRKG